MKKINPKDFVVTNRDVTEIAEVEGIVVGPYLDSQGYWTFGIGHTANAGGLDPEKMPRGMPDDVDAAILHAVDVYKVDLQNFLDDIKDAIKVPLFPWQKTACLSFHINTGGIRRARLTKAINEGDPNASRHFMGWLKPPEIRGRREGEMKLYDTGDWDANGDLIPIYSVKANGRLGHIIKRVKGSELLEIMGMKETKRVSDKAVPAIGGSILVAIAVFFNDIKEFIGGLF